MHKVIFKSSYVTIQQWDFNADFPPHEETIVVSDESIGTDDKKHGIC